MATKQVQISHDREMELLGHLSELRTSLIWAIGSLLVVTAATFFLGGAKWLIQFLAQPVGGLSNLSVIDPTESVGVYMRVSLLGGFVVAVPIIVALILNYVKPGLTKDEMRWVYTAVPTATILFVAGVAFTYFVMLPVTIAFLQKGFLEGLRNDWRLSTYIEFITTLMLWIGVSFEAPLVVNVLAKFGLVGWQGLLKQWRIAVIVIAIAAAFITPTVDVMTMSFLMVPLFAIYLLSVFFAMLAQMDFSFFTGIDELDDED